VTTHNGSAPPLRADFSHLAEIQSRTLGKLLEEGAGGSALALNIKQAEMATADLAIAVTYSKMRGKEEVTEHLHGFVKDAKKTSRGLQRFGAKLGGAVDQFVLLSSLSHIVVNAMIHLQNYCCKQLRHPLN
jgi:hypothetical protein